jgi:XRE family aerobic/anaerobic benzoate catabolism transcriptional regulator
MEAGQANIAIGRLAQVAQALDVDITALLTTTPSPTIAEPLERVLGSIRPDQVELCVRALEVALGRTEGTSVALVGLRGAGKSTLGPLLAEAQGCAFVELDQIVEERAGLALAEIFALHGEQYYRRLERDCLVSLLAEKRPHVLALSGGLVNNQEAWSLVKSHCHTVWLKASPEDHMNRVLAQGDTRPTRGRENAMEELRGLLIQRESSYGQCDTVIDTSAGSLAEVTEALTRQVPRLN